MYVCVYIYIMAINKHFFNDGLTSDTNINQSTDRKTVHVPGENVRMIIIYKHGDSFYWLNRK